MNHIINFLVINLLYLFLSTSVNAQGLPRLDMWQEPSHQLVYQDKDLRILDIRIVPGVTSGFHVHDHATGYVIIQDALLTNQNYGTPWSKPAIRAYRKPGTLEDMAVYVTNNSYHRVKNIDDVAFHFVAIVNLSDGVAKEEKASVNNPDDLLDNPWIKEHRITLNGNESSNKFMLNNDAVLVQYEDVKSYVLEDGIKHSFKSIRGALSVQKRNTEFQIVNDDNKASEFILLEVKGL